MAWTTPMTAVANSVFTASEYNVHVRDNLLETGPEKATSAQNVFRSDGANSIVERDVPTGFIGTAQDRTTTSYGDLATVGPSVTLDTGENVLVLWANWQSNSSSGGYTNTSFAVSGETTSSATDARRISWRSAFGGSVHAHGRSFFMTGLNPGENTFTLKYRPNTGTGTWSRREITVIPF